MKERPILFSGPMVRAILDGRKTQTRRVVKPQPPIRTTAPTGYEFSVAWHDYMCPYGKPGDRLWVRESGASMPLLCPDDKEQPLIFRHDVPTTEKLGHYWVQSTRQCGASYGTACTREQFLKHPGAKVVPSIHMPRWASRINLAITGVRVERLQDISGPGCWAEGINHDCEKYGSVVHSYQELWESINGPGSWDVNPWVWVVEFKRVS